MASIVVANSSPSFGGSGEGGFLEHLDKFRIINMNGRLYDPVIGRFFSPDPYVPNANNSQDFNRYSYARNNPLMYTDPDGEWIHLVIGAAIGGVMNWATNGAEFSWKGLGYFGVGAVSGALGAGIGAGVNSMFIAGGSFAGGFLGTSTAGVATGFCAGSVAGLAGGAVSGFTTGFGNGLLQNKGWSQSLINGGWGALYAGIAGGVLGGVTGGIAAKSQGKNFLNGSIKTRDILVNQDITHTLQKGDINCVPANIASTSDGRYTQEQIREMVAPGTDPQFDLINTYHATSTYANEIGVPFNYVDLRTTSLSAEQYAAMMNGGQGNNAILSIGQGNLPGHTVTLKNIVNETIIKQSGRIINRTLYTVMDPAFGGFIKYTNSIPGARGAFFIGIVRYIATF